MGIKNLFFVLNRVFDTRSASYLMPVPTTVLFI